MTLSTSKNAWRRKPKPRVRERLKALGISLQVFSTGILRPINEARLIANGDLIPAEPERRLIAFLLRTEPEALFPSKKRIEGENTHEEYKAAS